ncbi:MAG: hypothetical protein QM602_06195 [Microbacterium sp.]
MTLAGLLLLAIGAVDLVRQFASGTLRWIGFAAVVVVVVALGIVSGALLSTLVAVLGGVLWVWTMPDRSDVRQTSWPAAVLAVVCVLSVVALGDEGSRGGQVASPFGPLSLDLVILTCGVVAVLLETGNVVVRAALAGEHAWRPSPTEGGFRGGRLIGPLERVLVFLLMLVPAYTILAAILAAKGIVRFPEISKDNETGARAEYFLVGSLVSWAMALGGALLVWWAANA